MRIRSSSFPQASSSVGKSDLQSREITSLFSLQKSGGTKAAQAAQASPLRQDLVELTSRLKNEQLSDDEIADAFVQLVVKHRADLQDPKMAAGAQEGVSEFVKQDQHLSSKIAQALRKLVSSSTKA